MHRRIQILLAAAIIAGSGLIPTIGLSGHISNDHHSGASAVDRSELVASDPLRTIAYVAHLQANQPEPCEMCDFVYDIFSGDTDEEQTGE